MVSPRTTFVCLGAALIGLACFKPPIAIDDAGDDVGTDSDSSDTTADDSTVGTLTDTTTDTTTTTTTTTTGMAACVEALDILVVVDNSGSMGDEQRKLATGIAALLDPLEAANVDWRLGVTTSDNSNPWCPVGTTTPEGGNFVATPCTNRLGDFLFGDSIDVQAEACTDICNLEDAQLEIQPTTTAVDPNPAPRPWFENIGGVTNLPAGTDMADALACFLPQGVNGCGFESQLESGHLALIRSQSASEANYGFLRDGAGLLVVLFSDEADCSYNKDWSAIFEQDGNKVFWSDPNASFPTSAVCWNAGVSCTGDPSNYDTCMATNYDVNGNIAANPADAVLQPLSRYENMLSALSTEKPNLRVALIAGVGPDGQPSYADVNDTDPAFQDSFGIGPGCEAPNPFDPNNPNKAVPPVRMFEIAEGFGGDTHSICDESLAGALGTIASAFVDEC